MRASIFSTVLAVWLLTVKALPQNSPLLSLKRQTLPDVPNKCKNPCDGVNAQLILGCQPSECCTKSFETDYYNCAICIGKSVNATGSDWAGAQADLDLYVATCQAKGYNITKVTLPDQNPHRTLSSLPVSQSTVTALSTTATAGNSVTAAPTIPTSLSQNTITTQPATASLPTVSVAASGNNGIVANAQVAVALFVAGAIGLVL